MKINIKKGFTLIELLIVIAVIGILAATIIPSLAAARKRATESKFVQTMKGYQSAFVLCCDQLGASINTFSAGGEICSKPIGSTYPPISFASFTASGASVSITSCGNTGRGDGTFSVTFTPPTNKFGNCSSAIITEAGVTFTASTAATSYGGL